ncbi:carbohydrate esterase family 4 protein [Xylariomycetidae sp. FL2044]|nr:carbohydrate esterase family 4 protein [Xylariomycetidae sp. FL2044]
MFGYGQEISCLFPRSRRLLRHTGLLTVAMLWLKAVTLASCVGFAAAHTDPNDAHHASPRLVGGQRFLNDFRGRRRWLQEGLHDFEEPGMGEVQAEGNTEAHQDLDKRQSGGTSGRCGAGRGSCATGYCCSYEGWCGKDTESCQAPDCQITYGSGCDGNQKPTGVDTSTIARPKLGKIAYGGVGIYDCVNNGDIAVTFDDGPWDYTDDLLDKLAEYEAKATFFITGNNIAKGHINDPDLPWASVIQRMAAEGHQIASHTWSHENFSAITSTQAKNQMIWNEIAFNDILGYFPTYMRPPYSICESACQTMLATLGYHVIYFDLDTEGYLHDSAKEIQTSKDIWDDAVDGSNPCRDSYLEIEHDIHYQTVYNLTDYLLESLFNHGYRSVTVGQCLGDPPENWYRAGSKTVPEYNFNLRAPTGTWSCLSTRTSSPTTTSRPTITTTRPTTPTSTLVVSPDGTCKAGITCQGSAYGNCCSVNGWCGASIDYCGANCNPAFGTCADADEPLPQDDPLPTGPGTIVPDDPLPTSTGATPPTPTGSLQVSVNGDCGGTITCEGSEFGNCCSEHGWCGIGAEYCSTGCQSAFGSGCQVSEPSTPVTPTTTKTSSSLSSPTATARPTTGPLVSSRDGTCGPGTGYTCEGTAYGLCCSTKGHCALLCLVGGCLPGYGSLCILPDQPQYNGTAV